MKCYVRKHERALLFRDGDFDKFLEPGVHRLVTVLHRYTITTFNVRRGSRVFGDVQARLGAQ